jgi:transposase-like protein
VVDAIRVKIRNEGMVNDRAVNLAIGVRCSCQEEIRDSESSRPNARNSVSA